MNGIEQFTHIARPVVTNQSHHHWLWHQRARPTQFRRVLADGVIHQQRNVLAPFPKRGNDNLRTADSVVKILAEAAIL